MSLSISFIFTLPGILCSFFFFFFFSNCSCCQLILKNIYEFLVKDNACLWRTRQQIILINVYRFLAGAAAKDSGVLMRDQLSKECHSLTRSVDLKKPFYRSESSIGWANSYFSLILSLTYYVIYFVMLS